MKNGAPPRWSAWINSVKSKPVQQHIVIVTQAAVPIKSAVIKSCHVSHKGRRKRPERGDLGADEMAPLRYVMWEP